MSLLKNKKILLLLSLFLIFIPLTLGNKLNADNSWNYKLIEKNKVLYLNQILSGSQPIHTADSDNYILVISKESIQYSSVFNFSFNFKSEDIRLYKKYKIEVLRNNVIHEDSEFDATIGDYHLNNGIGLSLEWNYDTKTGFLTFGNGVVTGVEIDNPEDIKVRYSFYDKKDNVSPTISGQTIFLSDVDSPIALDTIKNNLRVYDEIDGAIDKSKIYIKEDNFSINRKKVGNFNVTFAVKDKAENEATFVVTVKNMDLKKPEINSVKDSYEVSYKDTLDLNSVLLGLSVTDNYDTGIIQITLKTNNYTLNKNVPGVYILTYEAKDSSNNIALKNITVKVVDNIKPIVSGQFNWEVSYKTPLSIETIKSKLVVSDEIDKTLTSASFKLKTDNYSSMYNRPGKYQIHFIVSDAAKNESTAIVLINVKDDQAPTIITNDYFISFDKVNTMSREQIIEFMKSKGLLPTNFTIGKNTNEYSLVSDSYSASISNGYSQEGKYLMSFKNNNTGEQININVLSNEPDLLNDVGKNVWQDTKDWFSKNGKYLILGFIAFVAILGGAIIYRNLRGRGRYRRF